MLNQTLSGPRPWDVVGGERGSCREQCETETLEGHKFCNVPCRYLLRSPDRRTFEFRTFSGCGSRSRYLNSLFLFLCNHGPTPDTASLISLVVPIHTLTEMHQMPTSLPDKRSV